MIRFIRVLFALVAFASSVSAQEKLPVVAGYFAEWGIYDRNYHVMDIPADRITHVIYAFAKIEKGEIALCDPYAAVEKSYPGDAWNEEIRGNFKQLQKLKAKHPHLKTLIAVGGWTCSDAFSDMALTAASRRKFAVSVAHFVKKYGFDGVDIDWEYPCGGGLAKGRPQDKQNFTLLMAELKQQLMLVNKDYLLTVASAAGNQMNHYELGEVAKYIDWYNLMTYDFHGAWENTTNHQAALYPSVANAVAQYMKHGVAADQIVLGIPFYSRGWSGVSGDHSGLYQTSQKPAKGTYESGIIDYWDLMQRIQKQPESYLVYWDDEAKTSWVYNPYLEGGSFFTFEDVKTVKEKVRFIREMHLRGAMFWEFSGDLTDSKNPSALINAL